MQLFRRTKTKKQNKKYLLGCHLVPEFAWQGRIAWEVSEVKATVWEDSGQVGQIVLGDVSSEDDLSLGTRGT